MISQEAQEQIEGGAVLCARCKEHCRKENNKVTETKYEKNDYLTKDVKGANGRLIESNI